MLSAGSWATGAAPSAVIKLDPAGKDEAKVGQASAKAMFIDLFVHQHQIGLDWRSKGMHRHSFCSSRFVYQDRVAVSYLTSLMDYLAADSP